MPAWGAKPYKIYVVNKYGAYDIVCDSYTVKKNDHIWDILRRRGSLAEQDFPRFVRILKDMNPGVQDVDKIYPEQKILIPLKEIPARGSRSESGPRYVTIPMIPDVLYKGYTVSAGQCLSKILTAHLQVRWEELSNSYFKTFRRLNPKITDLDLIYPGQTIRIPELPSFEAPEAESAVVASREDQKIQELAAQGTQEKPVVETKEGKSMKVETVAPPLPIDVTARDAEKQSPQEPKSSGVSDTGTGDTIGPDVSREKNALKYGSTSPSGEVGTRKHETAKPARVISTNGVNVVTSGDVSVIPRWQNVVSVVADQVGGKLLATGHCYFPAEDQEDVALDLAAFPVVELRNGQHVLFQSQTLLPRDAEDIIRNSWKGLLIIHADLDETDAVVLDKVFRAVHGESLQKDVSLPPFDDGIQVTLRGDWVLPNVERRGRRPRYYSVTLTDSPDEGTSAAVVSYLDTENIHVVDVVTTEKETGPPQSSHGQQSQRASALALDGSSPEAFVTGFVKALGFFYEPQVPLSFEYGGFQVETTANIVYGKDGSEVVVDFGTFYGDAKSAIEAGGMNVLSIKPDDELFAIAGRILNALGSVYVKDPAIYGANRDRSRMVSLAFPGFLISNEKDRKILLARKKLHPKLLDFLSEQQIETFQVKTMLKSES
jgi:hypothetical protein